MLHDTMPGTAEHLAEHQPISGYIGFAQRLELLQTVSSGLRLGTGRMRE